MTTKNREKMYDFFEIKDQKYKNSLLVNAQLLAMTKKEIMGALHRFGLNPIREYLDERTINTSGNNWNIRGYIRYMDTYLIETSGGKRSKLIRLGKQLTGQESHAYSMRLIRIEIITAFLTNLKKV